MSALPQTAPKGMGKEPRRRLSKAARRHQILDVAAEKVVELGLSAMSMERIAEWAGVSKALPYAHFDNVEALLVALYQREMVAVGREIITALDTAGPDDDLVTVRVRANFDAMEVRGPVIRALTSPGSTIPATSDPEGEGKRYTAGLLYRYHRVPKRRALAIGPVVQATLAGATVAWLHGGAARSEVEPTVVAMIRVATESAAPGALMPR